MTVKVIGAGLAGCEVAFALACAGIKVELIEQKPHKMSPAHSNANFAELVCSNSLKAARVNSAAGLLKYEMQQMGSLCVSTALKCSVPAGGALAVDRNIFSELITKEINNHINIKVTNKEQCDIDTKELTVIATGPLTSDTLAQSVKELCGQGLNFYDAASPIVSYDSIDFSKAFFASRYGRGDDDYINCAMDKAEYEAFYNELVNATSAELHEFEKEVKVYEGCMPIEVLGKRGLDTMRFGPLKPVGLTNPATGRRPWAVVQLRAENLNKTLYNLVGFQTNLKFDEQKRVFSMIPGLENAEFFRYGVMHRNTFINSPQLLTSNFNMINNSNIYFAGQITGVEGYMESAMSGLVVAKAIIAKLSGKEEPTYHRHTMIGALTGYISDRYVTNFQPMGANFGILEPLTEKIKDKQERYQALADRAIININL